MSFKAETLISCLSFILMPIKEHCLTSFILLFFLKNRKDKAQAQNCGEEE
jgi:hypothetical protein